MEGVKFLQVATQLILPFPQFMSFQLALQHLPATSLPHHLSIKPDEAAYSARHPPEHETAGERQNPF